MRAFGFLIFFLNLSLAYGQNTNSVSEVDLIENDHAMPVQVTQPMPVNPVKKRDKNEFIAAPIPFLNPSQGWGLALVGQYIFTLDDDPSPPSIVAGGGFYTEKHSFGGALGYLGKLHNDNWRVGVATGKATVFYDFYGVGYNQNKQDFKIPIRQVVSFIGFQVLHRIAERVYAGVELLGADLSTGVNSGDPQYQDQMDSLAIKNKFATPNLKIQRDARNDSFYPTDGSLADLTAEFHSKSFGDNNDYEAYKLAWNQYIQMFDFDVLALRLMTRLSYGDVPFYDLSSFGMQSDLRGYEAGKYRDKMMWAGQAEWRHRFTDRWGGVAFAGLGEVAPTVPEFNHAKILSSGGLGLRFKIAQKNPVDFRFDTAYGDRQISYYFSIGQAF